MKRKKAAAVIGTVAAIAVCAAGIFLYKVKFEEKRQDVLEEYMGYIEKGRYDKMYALLDEASRNTVSAEDFVVRNQKIYEGIEADNIRLDISDKQEKSQPISYKVTMDTVAGEISYDNDAFFEKESGKWRIKWSDSMIFPNLKAADKVSVVSIEAKRGEIYDRNGELLAGQGTVANVGLVPGKMAVQPQEELEAMAALLGTTAGSISDKLDASWVKDDSFVPVKKMTNSALETPAGEGEASLKDKLLELPGVMISDAESRVYPYGDCTSHLLGYVQEINAEELEELKGKGYDEQSILGKSGLEKLYEDRLKAQKGYKISIVDAEGNEKEALASVSAKDGENITLTIDGHLQQSVYEQYKNDKSSSIVMNPKTGEVLAMVSTPTFDSMDFVLGMSQEKWDSLNNDEDKPMFNRSRESWVPGSSFKPVIGAVGLTTGTLSADEDLGASGLSWQKDESWGDYRITTLHEYGGEAVLRNALIYSDNIYFAKAALRIGADTLTEQLKKLGFGEDIPFEIGMSKSQYSNEDGISSEIQLADSGYGQGQILVNPLHLACIYSAFVNEGNMIKPYLEIKDARGPEYWKAGVFSKEAAAVIQEDLTAVIADENGTGHGAYTEGANLAGKTGTAEIKASQDDESGTELGWFAVFNTDGDKKSSFLMLNMVEDVKDRGGSGYVVDLDKGLLDEMLTKE